MKTTFLHLGDVHLGNEQYGRRERANDFAEAFHYAVGYAIQQRVDFVLVAGDLFERSTLDPVTFDQAISGLKRLMFAGIPLVAIAGNHDRARYGQEMPWLESLGRQGFLVYLDAVGREGVNLVPWTPEDGIGGYLDIKGIRLVGFRYLGAATPRVVEELAEKLRPLNGPGHPFTVAMLHGGIDGIVPNYRAEINYSQLSPLRELVDYIALGHIHQHYVREDWVYNPGSLETWNAAEVGWSRGFLQVEVDASATPRHSVRLVEPPRRPFLRLRLDVEPCRGPDDLLELLRRSCREWAAGSRSEKPVVHLSLRGRLRFDRHDLDLRVLEAELESAFDPLVVQLRDQTEDTEFAVDLPDEASGPRLDRTVLEMRALQQLFANDERRVHRASGWARLAQELKLGTMAGENPERLADLVRRELPALLAALPETPGGEETNGHEAASAEKESLSALEAGLRPAPTPDQTASHLQPSLFGEGQDR